MIPSSALNELDAGQSEVIQRGSLLYEKKSFLQVWAGNEDCEPVTWRECKLVPRQVDFKVPKVNCEEGDEVPYTDCEEAEKTQMITKMACEVKHTTDCKPVTSTKCGNVQFQVRDCPFFI